MSLLRRRGYSSEFPLNLTRGLLMKKKNSFLCSCLWSLRNVFQGFSILIGEHSRTQLILKDHVLTVLCCFSPLLPPVCGSFGVFLLLCSSFWLASLVISTFMFCIASQRHSCFPIIASLVSETWYIGECTTLVSTHC
jgi:hypothetical protein